MTFRRFLSEAGLSLALKRWRRLFATWARTPGATIHLRRSDEIAFYFLGHKALWIADVGSDTPKVRAWDRDELGGSDELEVEAILNRARSEILEHVERRDTGDSERAVQGRVLQRLFDPDSEFWLVDEQVQIPMSVLAARTLGEVRPDALLVERASGDLWLVEAKLARSADLDGPVLEQVRESVCLPHEVRGGLVGGPRAFVSHYEEVLRQRAFLGMIPGEPPRLSERVQSAILAIGEENDALGRIACWTGDLTDEALIATLDPTDRVARRTFASCRAARERALATAERTPHAPRRSRWTRFAVSEDQRLAAWRRDQPSAHQLGAHASAITSYFESHDAPKHNEIEHRRSSQAACLQVFAPVLVGDAMPVQGFLDAVNRAVLHAKGIEATRVAECQFEVPHRGKCLNAGCSMADDLTELAGEVGALRCSPRRG